MVAAARFSEQSLLPGNGFVDARNASGEINSATPVLLRLSSFMLRR